MVGLLVDGMIVPTSDGSMFILINGKFLVSSVRFQTVHHRISLKKKIHFFKQFLAKFLSKFC